MAPLALEAKLQIHWLSLLLSCVPSFSYLHSAHCLLLCLALCTFPHFISPFHSFSGFKIKFMHNFPEVSHHSDLNQHHLLELRSITQYVFRA